MSIYEEKSQVNNSIKIHFRNFFRHIEKKNPPYLGWSAKFNKNKIKAVTGSNQHYTICDMANELNLSNSTIYYHFKLCLVKKLSIWVPDELKEFDLIRRMNIYNQLNNAQKQSIIAGDDKYIVYNVKRKWSWT